MRKVEKTKKTKKLKSEGSEALYLAILMLSIAVLLLLSGYFIRNRKKYEKMSVCYGTNCDAKYGNGCKNGKCTNSTNPLDAKTTIDVNDDKIKSIKDNQLNLSKTILVDLNGDGKEEKISLELTKELTNEEKELLSKGEKVDSVLSGVSDKQKEIIKINDKEVKNDKDFYYTINKITVADLNTTDKSKEVVLEFSGEDDSLCYEFIKFNGNDISKIDIYYPDDMPVNKKAKTIELKYNCICTSKDGFPIIQNGYVATNTIDSDAQEVYQYTNGKLKLVKCRLTKDAQYYTNKNGAFGILSGYVDKQMVRSKKDESTAPDIELNENNRIVKVTEAEDLWLTVQLSDGSKAYVYYTDVRKEEGAK